MLGSGEHTGHLGPIECGQSTATTFRMADLIAIQGGTPYVCLPPDNGPVREILYPEAYVLT